MKDIILFNLENKDYLFISFDSYKDGYISQSMENVTLNDLINLDYQKLLLIMNNIMKE